MTTTLKTGPRPPDAVRQHGAAATETVVLMLVMVPLMFAVPMIGKLVDVNQTAVQAGRYATWEATVHEGTNGAGSAAPSQIADRFFGAGDTPILSGGVTAELNPLWGDGTAGEGGWDAATRVEIDGTSVETIRFGEAADAHLPVSGAIGGAIGTAGDLLADATRDSEWGIGPTALTRSGVRVKVKSNGWFDEALGRCGGAFACLEEAGVIMTDGWSAGSEREMTERVQALVPAKVLEPVGEVLSEMGRVPFLEELRPLDEAFGHVGDFPGPGAIRPGKADYGLPDYIEE